jgi:plastocyanin
MKTIFTFKKETSFMRLLPLLALLPFCLPVDGQTLHVVEVRDTQFDPAALEITAGDTVEWRNVQGYHNVNGTQTTYPSNPESFGNNAGNNWTFRHVFATAGSYSYQCDPHVSLGMTGTVTVLEGEENGEQFMLSVDFMSMNPHVGQDFYLAVVEKGTGMEVGRADTTADVEFTIEISGIEDGKSYHVDFWADHNRNGVYDAPPADHAWRIELTDVQGDTTLVFTHNTNFTDIMWKNLLTVEFSGMNPHTGQDLYLGVKDAVTGMEVGRTHAVADSVFSLSVPGIEPGKSYHVDFWADFNENGMYDSPPTDHAWRIELNDVMGDTTLTFIHNTDFTDIMWKNLLTVEFSGMNPHIGQHLYMAVKNTATGMEAGRTHAVADSAFTVHVPGIEPGQSYHVDFWVDFNENGRYDAPPADHAWRLELNDVMGDTTLMFMHNTDFTDIEWKHILTVRFSDMTPHIGQLFELYVTNTEDGMIKDTVIIEELTSADFEVTSASLMSGHSYTVNFFADFNDNGVYDAPPVDHAWQIVLDSISGDTTITFVHNTDFTDIFPATSVNQPENNRFRMYPNPSSGSVTIETGHSEAAAYRLAVYDMAGRLTKVDVRTFSNQIKFDVQPLNRGIYFIELKRSGERTVLKLVKD